MFYVEPQAIRLWVKNPIVTEFYFSIVRKAKAYVSKNEGELAQSKRSKDVFAKYTLLWSRVSKGFSMNSGTLTITWQHFYNAERRLTSPFYDGLVCLPLDE